MVVLKLPALISDFTILSEISCYYLLIKLITRVILWLDNRNIDGILLLMSFHSTGFKRRISPLFFISHAVHSSPSSASKRDKYLFYSVNGMKTLILGPGRWLKRWRPSNTTSENIFQGCKKSTTEMKSALVC